MQLRRFKWKACLMATGLVCALGSLSGGGGSAPDWLRSLASLRMTSRPALRHADFRPEWRRRSGFMGQNLEQNTSVLGRRDSAEPPAAQDDSIWSLSVLEKSAAVSANSGQGRLQRDVRERLEKMEQERETGERHHLLGQQQMLDWSQQNRALGRTFLRSLLSMQIRDSLKKAEKRSPEVRAAARVQEKVDWLATQGVTVAVDEQWSFGTRADFPRQTGRLWMNSPILNSTLDFRVGGQETGLGASSDEAVRLAVGRPLLWDIESGVVYGGSSRTVTTQLSRPLSANLTCSLENRQVWADPKSEQTARVNYQVVF